MIKLTRKLAFLPSLSLFWRLFLGLLIILLTTSALSFAIARGLTAQEIAKRMDKQVDTLLILRQQLVEYLQADDLSAVQQMYAENHQQLRQIQVIDAQGMVIFPSYHQPARQPTSQPNSQTDVVVNNHNDNLADDNSQPYPANGKSPAKSPNFPTFFPQNNDFYQNRPELADIKVNSTNGQVYTIELQPQLPFPELMALYRSNFGLRFLIILIFVVAVCFWLSRILTRRIQRVQHSVHRMMAGDYQVDTQLMKLGNDEFGQLAQDIAHLSERLADSELARKQMLSDISHELRSPLARLEIATELARDFSPNAGKYLDRIQKETARMNELIEHIIHIQSLQMQRYTISQDEQQAVDLVEIINQIGQDVCFEFQDKQINWQWQSPTSQKTDKTQDSQNFIIMGQAEQLHSALENVIRNAFMHTPMGGSVKVAMTLTTTTTAMAQTLSSQKQSAIVISISDTGEGVAEKDLQRIFQPFVRLDTARHRKTGGYGLGLAIVHAVVMSHHGQIRAYNRTDTQGLTVEIELPVGG